MILVPAPGNSTTAPNPPDKTAGATTATPSASTASPVEIPDPIPGQAPSRPLILVPTSPAPETSISPGVGANAIDKSAIVYEAHPTAQVTDGDIRAGLLAAGVSPRLLPAFTRATRIVIAGESSGRTNAVNRSDSNAWGPTQADGAPANSSRGLMQTIPPTFAAYHAAGTSTHIYDPTANIAAGWRYASARYDVNLQTGAGLDAFLARGTGRGVGY